MAECYAFLLQKTTYGQKPGSVKGGGGAIDLPDDVNARGLKIWQGLKNSPNPPSTHTQVQ